MEKNNGASILEWWERQQYPISRYSSDKSALWKEEGWGQVGTQEDCDELAWVQSGYPLFPCSYPCFPPPFPLFSRMLWASQDPYNKLSLHSHIIEAFPDDSTKTETPSTSCPHHPNLVRRTGEFEMCLSGIWRLCQHVYVLSHFSHVWLFVTLWTIASQAPLSMGISKQESWSGPPPGDLPHPGMDPKSLTSSTTWEAPRMCDIHSKSQRWVEVTITRVSRVRGERAEVYFWDLSEQPQAAFKGYVKCFLWTGCGPLTRELGWVTLTSIH